MHGPGYVEFADVGYVFGWEAEGGEFGGGREGEGYVACGMDGEVRGVAWKGEGCGGGIG